MRFGVKRATRKIEVDGVRKSGIYTLFGKCPPAPATEWNNMEATDNSVVVKENTLNSGEHDLWLQTTLNIPKYCRQH